MERITDAHLHCELRGMDKQEQMEQLKDEMSRFGIGKAVLYLINENDFEEKNYALDWGEKIIPAVMLDPRDSEADTKLKELKRHNIRLIKLLPYEQKLFYEDFDDI